MSDHSLAYHMLMFVHIRYVGDTLKEMIVIEGLIYLFCYRGLGFCGKKLFFSLPNDKFFHSQLHSKSHHVPPH